MACMQDAFLKPKCGSQKLLIELPPFLLAARSILPWKGSFAQGSKKKKETESGGRIRTSVHWRDTTCGTCILVGRSVLGWNCWASKPGRKMVQVVVENKYVDAWTIRRVWPAHNVIFFMQKRKKCDYWLLKWTFQDSLADFYGACMYHLWDSCICLSPDQCTAIFLCRRTLFWTYPKNWRSRKHRKTRYIRFICYAAFCHWEKWVGKHANCCPAAYID